MLELLARAKQDELVAQTRIINQRIQWEQVSRVTRLERALKAARGRIFAAEPQVPAGAH